MTTSHKGKQDATSPFWAEDLLKGMTPLKKNESAGLDGTLCEQIKQLFFFDKQYIEVADSQSYAESRK